MARVTLTRCQQCNFARFSMKYAGFVNMEVGFDIIFIVLE